MIEHKILEIINHFRLENYDLKKLKEILTFEEKEIIKQIAYSLTDLNGKKENIKEVDRKYITDNYRISSQTLSKWHKIGFLPPLRNLTPYTYDLDEVIEKMKQRNIQLKKPE